MIEHNYTTIYETFRLSGSIDANNFDIETEILNLTEKGFFEPLTGAEIVVNDKTEARTTHRLFTGIHDIIDSDEIRIDSNSYDIDLISTYRNARDEHLEITLIRRN